MVSFTFLRHAEGVHNVDAREHGPVAYTFPKNRDAPLTSDGWRQTVERSKLMDISEYTHIFCSPSLRCIQTLLGVAPMARTRYVILDDRLMEPQGGDICNKRAEKPDILSPEGWDKDNVSDDNPWDISGDILYKRVEGITRYILQSYPDSKVLIVSHHDWIKAWFHIYKEKLVSLRNCEVAHAWL